VRWRGQEEGEDRELDRDKEQREWLGWREMGNELEIGKEKSGKRTQKGESGKGIN
jgi:hypothetical protein